MFGAEMAGLKRGEGEEDAVIKQETKLLEEEQDVKKE